MVIVHQHQDGVKVKLSLYRPGKAVRNVGG